MHYDIDNKYLTINNTLIHNRQSKFLKQKFKVYTNELIVTG